MTAAEAQRAMVRMARAANGEHPNTLTLTTARRQYVRGEIEVETFERKVEAVLRADQWGWSTDLH